MLTLQYAPAKSAREPGKAHYAPTRQSFEELNTPAKVTGLGHIGFYMHHLELMMEFYEDFMGMQQTKVGPLGAFYSADPESCDHEIALINRRPSLEDPHWIRQISMRVESLDDPRDFKRRIHERGYQLDRIVSHASAIGCYFHDPENYPTEGWQTDSNVAEGVPFRQHRSYDERESVAQSCSIDLRIGLPVNIEEMDNAIDEAYGAAPERLYLVDVDGKVAYHQGAGPHFFDLDEWEQSIQVCAASVVSR